MKNQNLRKEKLKLKGYKFHGPRSKFTGIDKEIAGLREFVNNLTPPRRSEIIKILCEETSFPMPIYPLYTRAGLKTATPSIFGVSLYTNSFSFRWSVDNTSEGILTRKLFDLRALISSDSTRFKEDFFLDNFKTFYREPTILRERKGIDLGLISLEHVSLIEIPLAYWHYYGHNNFPSPLINLAKVHPEAKCNAISQTELVYDRGRGNLMMARLYSIDLDSLLGVSGLNKISYRLSKNNENVWGQLRESRK